MSKSKFNDLIDLSNLQIFNNILKTENKLFKFDFKKATRQNFKPHQIPLKKRYIAKLKTLTGQRLILSLRNGTNNFKSLTDNYIDQF